MVVNSSPTPPVALTPRFAAFARPGPVRLHGVTSLPAETTPIWGLAKSSSVNPTARSIARAPALVGPSVTSWDLILFGISAGS